MSSVDQDRPWTGDQLAAQRAVRHGVAPEPACHVVFRFSRLADGSETAAYQVPDEAVPLAPDTWPIWLARRELLAGGQLHVPLLVIRETLDAAGCLVDCTLERRLGAVDGPFCGEPARVDFAGPARLVRVYRVLRNGQLTQVALSPQVLPPAPRGPEPFAGEMRALEQHFGPGLQVIDAREPTLFEDVAGFASIVHLRLPDGTQLACGIGWHGTMPYVLVADFPRFDVPLALPPPDEAAVQEALHRLDLVRHETRLDDNGLAVMARRRGTVALFLLRCRGGRAAAEPYEAGDAQLRSPDQRAWLRYVEVHEGLKPLDLYVDGASSDLIVLTGDPGGHVWRHLVDADGVEAWRRPADDTAVAAVHRERLAPGTLADVQGGASADRQPPEQSRRLHGAAPFGTAVEAHFPGCAYDIEEAANCLALRRPTTAVFHCMKVVERGLWALGRRLGLAGFPDRLRGWGAILGALHAAAPAELLGLLTQLQCIRQRWHATGLDPAEKYTETEAALVFQAVGAFMQALAERCDESGQAVG